MTTSSQAKNTHWNLDNVVHSAFTPQNLELTIFPTEKCQFRCTYCYEDFEIGHMPSVVVDGIKSLIRQRASGLSSLKISWFGGEPLLAVDIIENIMSEALKISEMYGINLHSDMTTNGDLLTSNQLKKLTKLNISQYQITLDGPQSFHDKTRLRVKRGEGTFSSIWKNLVAAKESNLDFNIILRLHITPENKDSIVSFFHELNDKFVANDQRFVIFPMLVGDWGGPNEGKISYMQESDGEKILSTLYSINSTIAPNDNDSSPYVCYAAKPNAFTIRADGRIGKCTVALQNSLNTIGEINPDGTLKIKQDHASKWIEGWKNLDMEFLGCPLPKITSDHLETKIVKFIK